MSMTLVLEASPTVENRKASKGKALSGHPSLCRATKSNGDPCGQWAIAGGTVCRYHGGSTRHIKEAAKRRLAAADARLDLAKMGVRIETTPAEALEEMLYESAGNVAVLREMVNELSSLDAVDDRHVNERHIYVVLYNEERDRLHRFAKDCAALGIDMRKVNLLEAQAARTFEAVTDALKLIAPDQRQAVLAELAKNLRRGALTAG